MTRVLLVIAIFVIVFYLDRELRQGLRRFGSPVPRDGSARSRATSTSVLSDRLVSCDRCGVHVPAASALASRSAGDASHYCSERCRSAGPRDP